MTKTHYIMLDREILMQIQAAYTAGYKKGLADCGKLSPYITQKEAHKKYGRRTVERWADEGLIEIIKDGPGTCRCRIDRERIELVASESNRCSWFENH